MSQMPFNTPTKRSSARWWLILLIPFVVFVAIVFVYVGLVIAIVIAAPDMRASNLRGFQVPSSAMEPAIMKGDRIIADMDYYRSHRPRDGDIVVYQRERAFFIKRIIASAGETIRGARGAVYVDTKLLDEPYVQHTGDPTVDLTDFGPEQVPSDNYFVMGDNRDISLDSRTPEHGYVAADTIVGRPIRVLFSSRLKRFGMSIR